MSVSKLRNGLTAKQELFAQSVASGMTQSDAYRKAYNCQNMGNKTINENASRTMADGKIAARVDELRAKLIEATLWKREDSVLFYREIVRNPEEKAQDRIKACERLDRMHGYDAPTKVEHSGGVGVQVVAMADMSAVLGDAASLPD